jgi:hypothetical protein
MTKPENVSDHLREAVRHLQEAAACTHRDYPELATFLWQYAESLSDCNLEYPIFTLTLPDDFILEVGSEMREEFDGPLWFTIFVPPRDE